jgi:hypothetical protein
VIGYIFPSRYCQSDRLVKLAIYRRRDCCHLYGFRRQLCADCGAGITGGGVVLKHAQNFGDFASPSWGGLIFLSSLTLCFWWL